jgi:4-amino-4-deoxy-L-arabinose transferase-like glycosyltransferase
MEVSAQTDMPTSDARVILQLKTVLWLILAIFICLTILARLVQLSMFFDGTIYASIARNMAQGHGTPWTPYFSNGLFSAFAEHPPLMMWLEAIGFLIFGDTIAVEKCFSFLTLLASGLLLTEIWKRLHRNDAWMAAMAPFALLMAVIPGRVSWAFANGMLENQLTAFSLAALLLVVIAYEQPEEMGRKRLLLIAASGAFTVLCVATKGPVGLFPLAAPGLHWLSLRQISWRHALWDTLLLTLVVTAAFVILWQFEEPRDAIRRYLSVQLLPSLNGQRGHNGAGWAAVRTFLRVSAYPITAASILLITAHGLGIKVLDGFEQHELRLRRAAFLVSVGFSASLPLLLSPRVSSFYFNPALIYLSAGLSVILTPALVGVFSRLSLNGRSRLQLILVLFLAGAVLSVAANFGRPGGDRPAIENASRIADTACGGDGRCAVSGCGSVLQDWALHAYLQRHHKASLEDDADTPHRFLVVGANCQENTEGFRETGVELERYRLLER